MDIKIFMQTAPNDVEHNLLISAGRGLEEWTRHHGGRVNYSYGEAYEKCDLALFMGSWKPRDKGHHVVRTSVATSAKTFICIETALLGRKTSTVNTHYRIGINGFLNGSAHWPDYDAEQGQHRLTHLGLGSWAGWRNNQDGHILVALQLPGDASLRGTDINEWALNIVTEIRRHTPRPIVVRSHPLVSDRGSLSYAPLAIGLLTGQIQNVRYSNGAERTWESDLEGAYCTVTYTSGLAIDSIIAGVPTIACDPGNFAFELSSRFAHEVENLRMADNHTVARWLQQLAINQWTSNEMTELPVWNSYMNVVRRML